MKVQVMLTVMAFATAMAGTAAAQGAYGTFAPNAKKSTTGFGGWSTQSTGVGGWAAPPSHVRSYASPPPAQGFKPYEPFRPSSVYSQPRSYGAPSGAKDCELSVYVNACGKRR